MKAFFAKIWAWVLANKVLAAIIAGGTAVVLAVAIAVPCGVSAAKKKKAAQEETSIPGDNSGSQQGGQQGGGGEGGGNQGHTHNYVFKEFNWTETPGAYTAKAVYECAADHETTDYVATVTKLPTSVAATCQNAGVNKWHAEYDGHEDNKDENVPALGHNWQVDHWDWAGISAAIAHFVCANDPAHTDSVTASGEDITSVVTHEPTCGATGTRTYTATVTFNGQTYTDTKDDSIPTTGIHTPSGHGFCSVCGSYLGDEQALNSEFLVTASGTYYFTVPYSVGHHYYFCLEDNETQAVDELRAYIKVNGELVEQAHADDAMCDEDGLLAEHYPTLLYVTDPSDDSLLYVEIDEATNAGLAFNMTVSDEHLYNNVNLCVGGDHYDGLDKDLNTQINLGEFNGEHYILGTDDTTYFRFNCYASHSYKLARNNVNAGEVTFYYQNRTTKAMIELVRNGSGVFQLPGSALFDGYVYCVISPLMQLQDAHIRLTVEGHGEPPALNDYGFCEADDVYLGTELASDFIETGINIDSGEKAFYKFAYDAGHKYSFGDTSGEINYQWIKAYTYNNTSDDFEEILLSHVNPLNYTPFMEDEDTDGFIYLVITAGANVTNGQLDITTIHNYEHGLCTVCYDYLGDYLTLDVAASPISVLEGEHVYFCFDLSDLPANKPVLEITYTSGSSSATCISSNIVTVWYLKNNVWTALEADDWYGGNWDVEYYPTTGITTDDGNVYIDIHANHAYTNSPGFMVSAVEE